MAARRSTSSVFCQADPSDSMKSPATRPPIGDPCMPAQPGQLQCREAQPGQEPGLQQRPVKCERQTSFIDASIEDGDVQGAVSLAVRPDEALLSAVVADVALHGLGLGAIAGLPGLINLPSADIRQVRSLRAPASPAGCGALLRSLRTVAWAVCRSMSATCARTRSGLESLGRAGAIKKGRGGEAARARTVSRHPRAASVRQRCWPMPEPPPVTSTDAPCRRMAGAGERGGGGGSGGGGEGDRVWPGAGRREEWGAAVPGACGAPSAVRCHHW